MKEIARLLLHLFVMNRISSLFSKHPMSLLAEPVGLSMEHCREISSSFFVSSEVDPMQPPIEPLAPVLCLSLRQIMCWILLLSIGSSSSKTIALRIGTATLNIDSIIFTTASKANPCRFFGPIPHLIASWTRWQATSDYEPKAKR